MARLAPEALGLGCAAELRAPRLRAPALVPFAATASFKRSTRRRRTTTSLRSIPSAKARSRCCAAVAGLGPFGELQVADQPTLHDRIAAVPAQRQRLAEEQLLVDPRRDAALELGGRRRRARSPHERRESRRSTWAVVRSITRSVPEGGDGPRMIAAVLRRGALRSQGSGVRGERNISRAGTRSARTRRAPGSCARGLHGSSRRAPRRSCRGGRSRRPVAMQSCWLQRQVGFSRTRA